MHNEGHKGCVSTPHLPSTHIDTQRHATHRHMHKYYGSIEVSLLFPKPHPRAIHTRSTKPNPVAHHARISTRGPAHDVVCARRGTGHGARRDRPDPLGPASSRAARVVGASRSNSPASRAAKEKGRLKGGRIQSTAAKQKASRQGSRGGQGRGRWGSSQSIQRLLSRSWGCPCSATRRCPLHAESHRGNSFRVPSLFSTSPWAWGGVAHAREAAAAR